MVMATKKQLFRGAHDILNNRRLSYEKNGTSILRSLESCDNR